MVVAPQVQEHSQRASPRSLLCLPFDRQTSKRRVPSEINQRAGHAASLQAPGGTAGLARGKAPATYEVAQPTQKSLNYSTICHKSLVERVGA